MLPLRIDTPGEGSESDEAVPDGDADGAGAVGRSKFPADRRDVGLDGLVADVEARGDRLVRQPQREKFQNLELAPRQSLFLDVGDGLPVPVRGRRDEEGVGGVAGGARGGNRRRFTDYLDRRARQDRAEASAIGRRADQNHTHGLRQILLGPLTDGPVDLVNLSASRDSERNAAADAVAGQQFEQVLG